MLLKGINKKIKSKEEAYAVYIGILQAISNFKITDQEKKVLSIILRNGKLTKDVRAELFQIASKARVQNILSKLRAKKILIGNVPNSKFPAIDFEETSLMITLKPEVSNEGNK